MAKMVKAQALNLLRNAISDIVDDPTRSPKICCTLQLERQAGGLGKAGRHDLTPATWRRARHYPH